MTLAGGLSWTEALERLLLALGRSAEVLPDGPDGLEDAVRGQGLDARALAVADDLPDPETGGLLLEMADGSWRPLLAGPHGLQDLSADGALLPLSARLDHAGRAILLRPRLDLSAGLASFLSRHKARLTEVLGASLIVNLLALCFPVFGSFVYDKVLGNGITETLWALAIGLLLVVALDLSVRAVRALLMERLAVTTEAEIDHGLFRRLFASSLARQPSVGQVLDRYKQILSARDFVSSSYLLAAMDLPFLGLFLLAVAWIGGPMVLVPLVLGGLTVAAHWALSMPARDYEAQARRSGEQRFSLLADVLAVREAVVGGRLQDELMRRWRRTSDRAGVASGRARYWHALAHAVSAGSSNLAYVTAIVAGAHMIEARSLTTGGLLACTILTSRAMASLASVMLLLTRYREFRESLTEMDCLLPPPPQAEPPLPRGRLSGHVALVEVTCRLRREGPASLSSLSFTLAPGEMVGLAGRPGAGKTTLLRLLTGGLVPDQGQVLLDHLPLSALAPSDLSASIGYKPQDPCLLDGTIEDNLRAGNGSAGPDDLTDALRASGLLASIERGELSLATPVGPRGAFLSGGQRQMLALARALLGRPSLLILDEPTTGLDAEAEAHLTRSLAALKGRCTILACSHSRSILSACDRLMVLDRGRLVANGPTERVLVEG